MKKLSITLLLAIICSNLFAQVPSYIPTDGLQGWYPFNSNANNAFGTGKNGTVHGAAPTLDRFGIENSAYSFNTDTDQVYIDTTFFNVGWSNYTISFWCRADTFNMPPDLTQAMFNTGPHNGIILNYNWNNSGKYSAFVGSNPSLWGAWDVFLNAKSHDSITVHKWNHIVFSKDSDILYRFYVNGVLDTVMSTTIVVPDYYCKVMIGKDDPSSGFYEGFHGKLDDYGFWNRKLAKCEIVRLFDSSIYTYLTSVPANVTSPVLSTVHFSVTDTGAGNTYQWQENTGAGFTNLTTVAPYSGVTTPTLTITSVTSSMNGNKYRCVVVGSQVCQDTSAFARLTVTSLGVNNLSAAPAISISPNPTTGELSVSGAGKVDIKIYNTLGQLVKTGSKTEKISITELPTGLYTIKLFNENGALLYNDKVIKK